MGAYQKILETLLGRDKASSLTGLLYALAVVAWQLKEEGYGDWKMIALAIGIGLLLRFANERFPGVSELALLVAQRLAQMPAVKAPPKPSEIWQRKVEELQRQAIGLENENAALRAELALHQGQFRPHNPAPDYPRPDVEPRPQPNAMAANSVEVVIVDPTQK